MCCIKVSQEFGRSLLVELDHRVVQRVLVLVQPANDIIVDSASIVDQREMGLSFAFGWFGFLEWSTFPQMLVIQFALEGNVCCLWEHTLFFQDGEDAHWLQRSNDF